MANAGNNVLCFDYVITKYLSGERDKDADEQWRGIAVVSQLSECYLRWSRRRDQDGECDSLREVRYKLFW